MKERPIGFKQMLIPAILDSRKNMTRRTKGLEKVNENPDHWYFQSLVLHASSRFTFAPKDNYDLKFSDIIEVKCPYGQPGDRLWVRESFAIIGTNFTRGNDGMLIDESYQYVYKGEKQPHIEKLYKWKPPIFMPKSAARIWLEITYIRVERLRDISEEDAEREGPEIINWLEGHFPVYRKYHLKVNLGTLNPVLSFITLWESINGKGSWEKNPWVWVITFKKIKP